MSTRRDPGLVLELDLRKHLPVVVTHHEAGGLFLDNGGGKRRIVIANRAMSALGQKQTLRYFRGLRGVSWVRPASTLSPTAWAKHPLDNRARKLVRSAV